MSDGQKYEWSSYKACLPKGCPDCGCSGPHYCVGKTMPDFFGSRVMIDSSLPPDGFRFIECGHE